MKWILVTVIAMCAIGCIRGQNNDPPSIHCVGDDTNPQLYTVNVFIENLNGYNGFNQNCNATHRPGFGDGDVQKIVVMGRSTILPTVICRSFPLATQLKATSIQLNEIYSIYDCENLQFLDLSGNNITEIQANSFTNTKLKQINLSKNKIIDTHRNSLAHLTNYLEELNLSENPGIEINVNFFQYAVNLKSLDLSRCDLTELKLDWTKNMTGLQTLDVSHNPNLKEIPASIFYNFWNLQSLNMNNCSLTRLASYQFRYNSALDNVNLRYNNLVSIDNNLFRNQTALRTLRLDFNPFEESQLSDDMFLSLISLETLDMRGCNINRLKERWFLTTTELTSLDLSGNYISEIPYKTFGFENKLRQLYLYNNKLKTLKATSFGLLRDLKYLEVQSNQIEAVDAHFLQQPTSLNRAWFLNNKCINVNLENFYQTREENLKLFEGCFHAFDEIPVEFEADPEENFRFYSMRWDTLVLHVKAESNVSIILTDIQSEDLGSSLKIQLGMNRDLYNFIYENGTVVWEQEIDEGVLNKNEWRAFVISWKHKVLQIFQEGYQLPLTMHIIRKPFDINFFGVRADYHAAFHIRRISKNFLHADFPPIDFPATTAGPTTLPTTIGTTSAPVTP